MVSMLEDGNRTASEAIGTDDENDGVGGGNPLIEVVGVEFFSKLRF